MRKLALSFVAILALVLASCKCSPAARQAAVEVQDSHNLIVPEYKKYVNQDAALSVEQKDRRIKLAESLERLTEKLKKALEE